MDGASKKKKKEYKQAGEWCRGEGVLNTIISVTGEELKEKLEKCERERERSSCWC